MASQGSQSEVEAAVRTSVAVNTQNQQKLSSMIGDKIKACLIVNSASILTRFHAGYFRISLSLGGQALLWKKLMGTTGEVEFLNHLFHMLHPLGFLVLWSLALLINVLLSLLYIFRCLFFFEMVKEEFLHHVGGNYLFAPSISWLLLLQSAPFVVPKTVSYLVLWWVFAVPVVALDLKIYGQWFTKGKRFLSMVANPTTQLSVIGNLVGAQAAANMGWRESAFFLFALGMVHYVVLFVTLYQRLPCTDLLPAILRPSFFLFIAAPSVASLAWESIAGAFDTGSKMLFFLSLFFFTSLICRPTLFKRSMRSFNVAWWAYSFPLTVLALASTEYAHEVKDSIIANGLMLLLLALSVLVSVTLAVATVLNAKMLFPENDPIANLLNRLPTGLANATTTTNGKQ